MKFIIINFFFFFFVNLFSNDIEFIKFIKFIYFFLKFFMIRPIVKISLISHVGFYFIPSVQSTGFFCNVNLRK